MIIAIILVSILSLFFLIPLFVNKDYIISRSVVINRPVADVFAYVKMIRNQDHYNKWVMVDPAMKKEFRGVDGTNGFVYGWNGNKKAGEGEQEIMVIKENERVDTQIRFIRPFKSTAWALMTTTPRDQQTVVEWSMKGHSRYPLNLMNLFMNSLLGKDLEESLRNLKTILEKKP